MSSISKQQQQERRRLNIQHSRNTNAYFDRKEFSRERAIPPRHRELYPSSMKKSEEIKPFPSISSSSINSDISNRHPTNLAAAVLAARQQNYQPQTNLNTIQTLMNSLILQQQQQQSSPSTIQLQYQLTNALLATMIQQRLKETALQAQAQQIQAAIPTLLAAQALAYQQQSGQVISHPPTHSWNVAYPGTKFNNRPLVKFSPSMLIPNRFVGTNSILPTYQQVQEIERGISLDEAIHFKGAINITDVTSTKLIE